MWPNPQFPEEILNEKLHFLCSDMGCERVKLTKSDPDEWNEMKMSFLNGPMTNLLFYCHIFIYWEKVTSQEKFSHDLTLEVQIVWKISNVSMLLMEVSQCWKIVEFSKISVEMKNFKTFYEEPETNQKHDCWKICKVSKIFGYVAGVCELRFVKWVRFFERNCILKWVIFFASFCRVWDFLPESLKLTDKLQIWGFEPFIFRSKFRFWGLF